MAAVDHGEAIRRLWDAVNAEGPEAMLRWLAPSYVRHGSDRDYGREEWVAVLAERNRAFPDNRSALLDVLADGERIAYRWEAVGRHTGVYMRIPATGRVVRAAGITISRFENGLIAEEWASWNKTSVLHSLGILPIA